MDFTSSSVWMSARSLERWRRIWLLSLSPSWVSAAQSLSSQLPLLLYFNSQWWTNKWPACREVRGGVCEACQATEPDYPPDLLLQAALLVYYNGALCVGQLGYRLQHFPSNDCRRYWTGNSALYILHGSRAQSIVHLLLWRHLSGRERKFRRMEIVANLNTILFSFDLHFRVPNLRLLWEAFRGICWHPSIVVMCVSSYCARSATSPWPCPSSVPLWPPLPQCVVCDWVVYWLSNLL